MEYIGQLVGAIVALFGVGTYIYDKVVSRRDLTIDKVGELLEEYHEKYAGLEIEGHYKEHVRFLSKIEQFCIAVDSKVYDRRTLRKFGSKFLTNLYKQYENNVIARRRTQFKDGCYRYFEKLVKWF